ncbi:MAG: 16S rRNA (adenine(1518)-N(6)/adenine(1519)-N(6))-dimethyltransferase RsmA [Thermodesulfobacteriota bacterium]|nr:16S rRNA (adenine(1518)-N(6)/adenine(1519)-N(6))-dimethyltransferase RsmA [Thermodesulfobacteriota bacterium]
MPRSGRFAKKSLGQHFLNDPNLARKIVNSLDVGPGDKVLEIGPGRGALSVRIKAKGPRIFAALEKDVNLALDLKQGHPGIFVVAADALEYAWELLLPVRSWKIIGNLPYNVASPLMWELFSRCSGLRLAVFMVQKEVGARLAANPGTKSYGALSVWVRSFVAVEPLFTVPPGAFTPKPKVDSMVLAFSPSAPKVQFQPPALAQLLRICFQKRRKQMGNILKPFWSPDMEDWFAAQGLDKRVRPEELDPSQFQGLSFIFEGR